VVILVTLKLIFLTSVYSLTQAPVENPFVQKDNEPAKEINIGKEGGEINRAVNNELYAEYKDAYDGYSLNAGWDDYLYPRNKSGLFSERYVASVKIDGILRSTSAEDRSAGGNGTILIGIKRPYYRIDKNPRVRGLVDLQMGGAIFGLESKGMISVFYDIKSRDEFREISTAISFNRFICRIIIPFSIR
jgi:hypothetical protein